MVVIHGLYPGKIINQQWEGNKYAHVGLCYLGEDGRSKTTVALVHRVVAEAFKGYCPVGKEVNHKDLDKTNNSPSNLEYKTHRFNLHHAVKNGAGVGQPKLSYSQVKTIRKLSKIIPTAVLSVHYKVSYSHLRAIINERYRRVAS